MSETRHTLDDLLTLMAVLRDPTQGCPWDIEQDWDSIVPHTLEEAYEVADAIERRAWDELPGELGDLLFQVVYYSQFAREERVSVFTTWYTLWSPRCCVGTRMSFPMVPWRHVARPVSAPSSWKRARRNWKKSTTAGNRSRPPSVANMLRLQC